MGYFKSHDLTTHDLMIGDLYINYQNQFTLQRKNYKHYATRAIFFWTKGRDYCFMLINVPPYHEELRCFSSTDYDSHSYWIASLNYLITLDIIKLFANKTAFRKCSTNRCSVKLNKIQGKVPMPESHLNTFARLQPVTLLRKRPRHRCFPVITLKLFMTF